MRFLNKLIYYWIMCLFYISVSLQSGLRGIYDVMRLKVVIKLKCQLDIWWHKASFCTQWNILCISSMHDFYTQLPLTKQAWLKRMNKSELSNRGKYFGACTAYETDLTFEMAVNRQLLFQGPATVRFPLCVWMHDSLTWFNGKQSSCWQ